MKDPLDRVLNFTPSMAFSQVLLHPKNTPRYYFNLWRFKIQQRNHDTDSHGGGGTSSAAELFSTVGSASVIQSMETLRKYQMVNSKLSVHPYAC